MRRKIYAILAVSILTMSLVGCNSSKTDGTNLKLESVDIKPASKVDQTAAPEAGETIAVMKVKGYGEIKMKFFLEDSPKAVENFLTLANSGYYDGVVFHRVIQDFMIQGGDFDGNGGQSIWQEPFENEYSDTLLPIRGALCMARTKSLDTNGSQFFIVQPEQVEEGTFEALEQRGKAFTKEQRDMFDEHGGYPFLTGDYTVFGQVYEGMDIVDQIIAVETDKADRPISDVVIESIKVSEY